MEGLGINLGYLIIQILGLLVLVVLMRAFAYEPILRLLEERQARIAKGLEDARQAAIARDNADAEAKKILEAARTEAAKLRADATVQAEESADGITSQAREEAKQILAAAREDAQEERDRILADLRSQVGDIAMAAANKLVGESLTEKRQHAIIHDFFASVPAGVKDLQGQKATVTSALPLTDNEKDAARKALKVQEVEFRVNPEVLGGLLVRVDDQIVDDSVAGQMSTLRDSLRR